MALHQLHFEETEGEVFLTDKQSLISADNNAKDNNDTCSQETTWTR
jgi:hypothetical protein